MIPEFEMKRIKFFIELIKFDEIYEIVPIISITGRSQDPFLTISNSILISSFSNPVTINNYLFKKLSVASEQFETDFDDYFLIFKYKKVSFNLPK